MVFVMGKKPTVVELFAGAGGFALGLELAGFDVLALNDFDKWACETLKLNRPEWNVIHGDIKSIDWSSYKADVVTGGFPCQPFSYAGKRLGMEDVRGTLFFEFARCVSEVRPKIFIGENVFGLKTHDEGRTLKTMISIMEKLGYDVQYQVLDALDYDVPQKRRRIFIVGTLPGITFRFPKPSGEIITLKKALENVPISPGVKYSQPKGDIMSLVPAGGSWVSLPKEVQMKYMGKSFYSGGGRRGAARRLSWDGPSPTLTTSPIQKLTEFCHPDETRPLTVREYARIQTFPDYWTFAGGIGAQYKQIGNAAPVNLAKALGKAVIGSLKTKGEISIMAKYKSVAGERINNELNKPKGSRGIYRAEYNEVS